MKLVLPMAGFGTRLRPHTWSRPKPLFQMAGKTILDHVLDGFDALDIREVVCIVGWLGDQIREHMEQHYDLATRFAVQQELKGQAHAIHLAKEHMSGPCIITWVDTLFQGDVSGVEAIDADVVAYALEVEDPRPFGVAVEENGRVVQFIEKPTTCDHHKCAIGLYYIREGEELIAAIQQLMDEGKQTRGEYYLTDALQMMIDRGAHVVTRPVSVWEDCGNPQTLFHAHRYLLENGRSQVSGTRGTVIVPPVHIAASARIERSIVGPHVSVGENADIRDSIVRDSIIQSAASVVSSTVEGSLIGRNATLSGASGRLNIGDDSSIVL